MTLNGKRLSLNVDSLVDQHAIVLHPDKLFVVVFWFHPLDTKTSLCYFEPLPKPDGVYIGQVPVDVPNVLFSV
jgi:hypothetical protein